ncbi:hypothetical protein Tco_0022852, partial [Tanacetum coccineum]
MATKRSKTQIHSSHVSGSGDGVDTQSKVPNEQQQKSSGINEGTDKDDENDFDDLSDEGDDNNDGDDDDANDDDKQEGDDTNNDDEETDSDRTESVRIKIPILGQSTTEFYEEEEEETIDDEETMYDDEDDEVTKELYDDVNQVEEDAHVTLTPVLDTQKADEPVQSSFVSSDFTSKLLNLENPSPADNKIASLMVTSAHHATVILENTSGFTTTIPLATLFFNPLLQQATPTPTPTTSEATTSFPSLLDFSSVFRFNDRVTNLEKDLSEITQVDQYAQALSSTPVIVDRYMDNKLGEAINKAILAHNLDCRQEAQDDKNAYI